MEVNGSHLSVKANCVNITLCNVFYCMKNKAKQLFLFQKRQVYLPHIAVFRNF
jgi:hypothetical protein